MRVVTIHTMMEKKDSFIPKENDEEMSTINLVLTYRYSEYSIG
jgi:hypothetical protein